MVSIESFRKLALSFSEVVELPHFEKISFRTNKKIFSTLDVKNKSAVVKLNEIDQSVFCSETSGAIYPVKGPWGKQGWTVIELAKVKKEILVDALSVSHQLINTKKSKPEK